MANRTVRDAKPVHGRNPQYLIEKIIRCRIYDSKYWKEECFGLTAELLVDKAMELKCIGGIHSSNAIPTPFLCLVLKMLQIQPEKDIVVEFIKNAEFKYVRGLGAFYMRLTGTSMDCYKYLTPLLNDNRKLRRLNKENQFEIIRMDEFIEELLTKERCEVMLPRIQKRHFLEEINELEAKVSALEDDMDEAIESSEEEEVLPSLKTENRERSEDYDRERDRIRNRRDRYSRSERRLDRGKRERKRSRSPKPQFSRSKENYRNKDQERETDRSCRRRERDRLRH